VKCPAQLRFRYRGFIVHEKTLKEVTYRCMKYEKGTFVVVPNIKELQKLEALSQCLFMWICTYADEYGQCYPSRARLAKNMSCAVRTVDNHLKKLVTAGFLTIKNRIKNNEKQTNIYQVMLVECRATNAGGRAGDALPSAGDALGGRAGDAHRTKSTYLTKSTELYTFDTFWSAYPVKKGKGAAEKSWQKLKPDLQTVLTAIEAQKQSDQWTKDNGKFIPYPATWLNQKRWEDEVETITQSKYLKYDS
jgi:DNA-binding transcriptional regulator YhcF (GntR family)